MENSQRRKRITLIIEVSFLTILCIGLIIIAIASGIFVPRGGPRQVDLRVESSSGVAMVTYSYPSTSVSNAFSVTTPWDKIVTLNGGDQVYLSAGNPSSFGKLTCTITVDNRPWKQVSVEYPSDKVGCAGIIP